MNGSVILTAGTILEPLARPDILITSSENALVDSNTRKYIEKDFLGNCALFLFLDIISTTINNGGNVLIPSDTSTRVLEILMFINGLKINAKCRIVFVCNGSSKTVQYAKSMLEWMNDSILQAFESNRESPLEFKFICY